MPEVIIVPDQQSAGELVADAIVQLVSSKPEAVLGLATGSTPLPVYRELARRVASGTVDMSRVRGFALDEYVGLPPGHPESYRTVIEREVVGPLGMNPDLVHVPAGDHDAIPTAGEEYELAIESAGGIDLQLLGVGTVGHIGFNEPGSSLASRTRVKTLTLQTRRDNARFFGSLDDVPMQAITQGLGTIMDSRHLVLIAFGEGKAAAIAGAVEGPLSAAHPASIIQMHPRVTVVVDEGAARLLNHAEYYRDAWENKPHWQSL